ncbi:hypothetical protein C6P46_004698 [Rhodotorula mucilaginosa]|uniref:Complexed with Cdc5 protein Cwf19 n=1 Tax=Rhodotorula mucilaginosa TaxID=5537 RepID=A0A9P6W225_RHOMI|nr:hypothetical protein C6P46_004698 [Rhodotorula mucilaginosa]
MGSHSRSEDRESSSRSKHSRSSRDDDAASSSKRHRRSHADEDRHRDKDSERKSSSHHHHRSHKHSSSRKRDDVSSSGRKKDAAHDANDDDDDEWVEKATEAASAAAPQAPVDTVGTFSIGSMPTSTAGLRRLEPQDMTDGYGQGDVGGSSERGGGLFGLPGGGGTTTDEGDFFGSFGTERRRKEPKEKVDPADTMGQSSRELNKAYWQGTPANAASASSAAVESASTPKSGSPAPGSSGSAWRMTKLKRTYEAAEEEGRSIEDVAMERYGSLEAFEDAKEERRVLDERGDRRKSRRSESGFGHGGTPAGARTPTGMTADGGGRRFVFTDMEATPGSGGGGDRPMSASRQSFRRPGETPPAMPPRTSSSSSVAGGPGGGGSASGSRPSTPIPSVFTPPVARRTTSALSQSTVLAPDPTSTGPATSAPNHGGKNVLSQSELNKLQARVLKAKLMDADDAAALEAEYERERKRSLEAGPAIAEHEGMEQTLGGSKKLGEGVQVLPTLDGRGRMYDVGVGTSVADQIEAERLAKGRRGKKEPKFETRDPKTGELIRNNADDDALTLDDLVRQERFSGGMNDQRALDTEVANRIATDARYSTDLDYIDDNAERFARKKMKSEALKRAFAVGDYARTKKALDSCTLCHSDDGDPPKAPVVALGTRTYLALMENEELVPGHCRIVPVQHYLSCLEIDEEEGWDEIKNFMKTLMQMFANEDKGVVFFETIVSHKYQNHSYIEAVPVPFDLFDQLPIYFSEAIQTSEAEWSQHKKLISFTPARPFRRALVPNLPYFAVQFDYKGEKGYGHIIEGVDDAPDRDLDGEETKGEVGDKGGGEFTRYFAHEIIGNLLSLEPRKWRKPRRLDRRENKARVADFRKKYDRYDWTKMLAQSSDQAEVEAGPSRF